MLKSNLQSARYIDMLLQYKPKVTQTALIPQVHKFRFQSSGPKSAIFIEIQLKARAQQMLKVLGSVMKTSAFTD